MGNAQGNFFAVAYVESLDVLVFFRYTRKEKEGQKGLRREGRGGNPNPKRKTS